MKAIADFCDLHLGKSVVCAKDTPNFIANRIGTFSMLNVMRVMQEMDLSVEEVDALTGSAVGWPKTGTFRLGDLVGLDILGHVVRNGAVNIKDERSELTLPPFFLEMLNRKWLGDKTKGGFYKKQKGPDGEKRFCLDWKTLEYREQQRPKFPALEMAKNIEDLPERLRTLIAPSKDKANTFLWNVLTDLWTYSANRVPEIADSIVEIDKAMKTGFNWEMGPFELWDACGVAEDRRAHEEGRPSRSPPTSRSCSPRARRPGTPTTPRPPAAASTSTSPPPTTSPKKFPPESGPSPSPRKPTAWSRRTPEPRSSISATASAASSSTPR